MRGKPQREFACNLDDEVSYAGCVEREMGFFSDESIHRWSGGVSAKANCSAEESSSRDRSLHGARVRLELTVDGRKVGDEVLSPEFSDLNQRVLCVTHDVTALLSKRWSHVGCDLR